jgi:LmbE family N-acetylglucosaminyl deacetylase
MAGLRHQRTTVCVISVTDGESAYENWPGLGAIRQTELLLALHRLCPDGVTVMRLGLPDGHLEDHEAALQRTLLPLVPKNCLLVAPYERDGHPDHDAVGRVCLTIAAIRRVPLARYPIWAWHHGDARSLAEAKWGLYPLSPQMQEYKRCAIAAYTSQLQPPCLKPIVPKHCLDYFRRPFEAFLL